MEDEIKEARTDLSDCAISRQALLSVAVFVAVSGSVLFAIIFILYLRLSKLNELHSSAPPLTTKVPLDCTPFSSESSSRFRFIGRR
ncbi:hypothetical protein L596_008440 [Steinernema carpocapsae]|uniref:Uncharacterized protein n=1 Tax=Steinernema carpocapsae TaxID=34508 RepID=A0A4U5PCS4_STECR|nr:hypothetical protein L596_008440 [Steinernema carpocapsae]